jgi:hypothetical protein
MPAKAGIHAVKPRRISFRRRKNQIPPKIKYKLVENLKSVRNPNISPTTPPPFHSPRPKSPQTNKLKDWSPRMIHK